MPVDILLRSEKGTALSHDEFDLNMTNLQNAVNAARLEVAVVTSATYDITTKNVILADATANSIVVTLPDPTVETDKEIIVKKTDSTINTVTLSQNASESIDGATTVILSSQYERVRVISNGTNWHIL